MATSPQPTDRTEPLIPPDGQIGDCHDAEISPDTIIPPWYGEVASSGVQDRSSVLVAVTCRDDQS
jgi:hypothetical protein